jgi:hypothetical protein
VEFFPTALEFLALDSEALYLVFTLPSEVLYFLHTL